MKRVPRLLCDVEDGGGPDEMIGVSYARLRHLERTNRLVGEAADWMADYRADMEAGERCPACGAGACSCA